jgi:tetratricopeptide (TPR) repeat protein
LRALYLSVLHGQRALLLFDNARDAAQVGLLLPPAGCLLLVTSRSHFALPGLRACDLDELPRADSVTLVREIAPRADELAAGELAALCGDLPLALRLTASLLAERADLGAGDVLRRLRDTQQRLALTGVAASLRLSYDLLNADLQRRWRTLAVFPAPFDRAAARAVWGMEDEDAAQDALGELVKASLLNYRAGRYGLHDLTRDFARAQCSAPEAAEAQLRHAEHYKGVLSAANDLYLQGNKNIARGLALFDLERTHIEAGQRWASDLSGLQDPTGLYQAAMRLCNDYPDAGVYVLNLRLHPRERIRWLEDGLRAARQLHARSTESAHLDNLGLAHANLGDARKAIEYHEKALVISREIGDKRGEGYEFGNLGNAYKDLGELRKAIEFYEQQLAIARAMRDRRDEGNALGNLGNAYNELGDMHKAIEFYVQQLVITREIGDRLGEGNALGNLGSAHYALNETRKATDFFEQALVIAREIGNRSGEGSALDNLGGVYYALGETRKAIEFFEQALVIAREVGDRRGEGSTLGNLGSAHDALGEPRRAIEFFEQALVIAREIGNRSGEGNTLGNFGIVYRKLGETRKAIEFFEQALVIAREIGERRGEGNALGNLGNAHAALGDARQAIEFYEQQLVIAREIGDRRGEGNALWYMALAFDKLGQRAEAIVNAEAALKIYEQIESPYAERVRRQLAQWEKSLQKKWWQFWK